MQVVRYADDSLPAVDSTNAISLEFLQSRIDRLESKVDLLQRSRDRRRRWVVTLGLVLIAVIGVGAGGVFKPSVQVQDPKTGKRIVDLVVTPSGAGGFQVWDRAGRRRILLGTNDQGQCGLTFWDSNGNITDRFWQGQNKQ